MLRIDNYVLLVTMSSEFEADQIVAQAVDQLKDKISQDVSLAHTKLNYTIDHFFKRRKVEQDSSASNNPGIPKSDLVLQSAEILEKIEAEAKATIQDVGLGGHLVVAEPQANNEGSRPKGEKDSQPR